jgi:hypothetical protein
MTAGPVGRSITTSSSRFPARSDPRTSQRTGRRQPPRRRPRCRWRGGYLRPGCHDAWPSGEPPAQNRTTKLTGGRQGRAKEIGEPNGEPTLADVRPHQAPTSHGSAARSPTNPYPAPSSDEADAPEKRKVGGSTPPLTTGSDQRKCARSNHLCAIRDACSLISRPSTTSGRWHFLRIASGDRLACLAKPAWAQRWLR